MSKFHCWLKRKVIKELHSADGDYSTYVRWTFVHNGHELGMTKEATERAIWEAYHEELPSRYYGGVGRAFVHVGGKLSKTHYRYYANYGMDI